MEVTSPNHSHHNLCQARSWVKRAFISYHLYFLKKGTVQKTMFRKRTSGWEAGSDYLQSNHSLRQNLHVHQSAHNSLNLRKYGSAEIELFEICPCIFCFFPFYLCQHLSTRLSFSSHLNVSNSFGKVKEREKNSMRNKSSALIWILDKNSYQALEKGIHLWSWSPSLPRNVQMESSFALLPDYRSRGCRVESINSRRDPKLT